MDSTCIHAYISGFAILRLHGPHRSLFALPQLVRLRVVRNAVSEEGAYGFAKSPEHAQWSITCM